MTFAVVVAFIIGVSILAGTIWSIRFIATGPPAEPDLDDVTEVDVPYVCSVCGMSLTVSQAQQGEFEPPRHCRELMVQA